MKGTIVTIVTAFLCAGALLGALTFTQNGEVLRAGGVNLVRGEKPEAPVRADEIQAPRHGPGHDDIQAPRTGQAG